MFSPIDEEIEYKNNLLTQFNIVEELNEENFHQLLNITQINPLITHYLDRTVIGRFQMKLYEYLLNTSSVDKIAMTKQLRRKSLGNYLDNNSSLRVSPRLHPSHRLDLESLSHVSL
mgnify:CR=1 FL=1